jgi:arginyl-tRNA synthetase
MNIKQQVESGLKKTLIELGVEGIDFQVNYSADPKFGDYSSNIALVAGKKMGRNPLELAEEIKNIITSVKPQHDVFDRLEVVKPGFINFFLQDKFLVQKLQNSNFDSQELMQREKRGKVIIEYSSPNIAKPFTIGHLRSTIIGDAAANLLEAAGHKVYRDNHVGDWGTQFGKQIYAIKRWGQEAEIASSERPVKLLVDLYVRFHEEAEKNPELEDEAREWFKRLEEGDEEARQLWQKCIEWSWKEFDEIYRKLGVPSGVEAEFENNGRGYGESFFEDKMKTVVDELSEKGLLKTGKEGAKIIEFPEETKLPPLMILKKDGASLYATRDLATDKFRIEKYGPDILIINEVGAEQSLYFQQLYKLEEMLGWFGKDQRVNLKHGLIRFADSKMSTRKGNTIWLEEVLEEAVKRAVRLGEKSGAAKASGLTKGEEVAENILRDNVDPGLAEVIGIGAIKWNDLKRDPKQDIVFDWDEVLNMQGNSGPYVQYVFARTQSVLEKSEIRNPKSEINTKYKILNTKYSLEPEERELLRLLARFGEIVEEAAERLAPNILCTYLFELAQAFNLFYQKHQILKAEEEAKNLRLFLTEKTGEAIKNGLKLLGIEAPVKM